MSIRDALNAMRDDAARQFEAEARTVGTAGVLFVYHCFRCHHQHQISSNVGRHHERHGDPATVKAAKRASLDFWQREQAG